MPVHLFGNPAEMDKIVKIANENNLKIIEDCAQSFGAKYYDKESSLNGKYTGTIGNAGAYSFFPTKNLGAYGDGGLIVTDDEKIAYRSNLYSLLNAAGYNFDFVGHLWNGSE